MIIYFSGTGNSRYIAKLVSESLNDELVSLNDIIKHDDGRTLCSDRPFVLVVPTYCYHIPVVVENYLKTAKLEGSRQLYFIMTCGGNIGSAAQANEKLCADMGLEHMGTCKLIMPDNYLPMYEPSTYEEAEAALDSARAKLPGIVSTIKDGGHFESSNVPFGVFISNAGSVLFNRFFVRPEKFTVSSECISCGKCETLCPMNNIKLQSGAPVWGSSCVHCIACISACPVNAVNYGQQTLNRRRYYLSSDGIQKSSQEEG